MNSVGETLRRERLRAGLDLDKIANDTKISVRMLELIEKDQFDKLPGGVFARSFVRQYAQELGIDAEEIVAELERTLEPPPEPEAAQAEAVKPEIRIPRVSDWSGTGSGLRPNSSLAALAVVVLVMLICSAAYTWWQRKGRAPAGTPQAVVVSPRASKVPPAATTAAAVPPPANPEPASAAAAVRVTAPEAETPKPEASAAAPTETSAVALRIALTAAEPTWVRATQNGKVVFSGILQPNETKALAAADTVTLRVGNAGGLSISLNGKPIPPIGPKGQVRIVQLSPDGGVQVEAPTPKPPQQQQTL